MKTPSQFTLPKSGKMLPPKKVNQILDAESDAAVGLPPKKLPKKPFTKKD